MDKVRIIFVGLGKRGQFLLGELCRMDDVDIVGVCDVYEDRTEKGKQTVEEIQGHTPFASTDYIEVFDNVKADAAITASSWQTHVPICIEAMKRGMYAATEVGGATSLEQCFELVRVSEETKMPCMMLENCCYNEFEMSIFKMVKMGLFGELVHAEGGYRHDLRGEVSGGKINRHYRLDNYKHRNGDLYPTHALGPIAKTLDINRGNRMIKLVSVASKARGLNAYIKSRGGEIMENADFPFACGDVVTTIISCAHGETITLTHDTTLPTPYSRCYLIEGTRGIASENNGSVISVEGVTPTNNGWDPNGFVKISEYYDKYRHPLWTAYRDEGVHAGHGGMDYLVLRAFVTSVRDYAPTPIDVYDTAAWMSITPLSEASVAMGGMPVDIPDFTGGKWMTREPERRTIFTLSEVCDEQFENLEKI